MAPRALPAGSPIAPVRAVWEKPPKADTSLAWKRVVVAVVVPQRQARPVTAESVVSPQAVQAQVVDATLVPRAEVMPPYPALVREMDVAPLRATAVSPIAPAREVVSGRHPKAGVAPAYPQGVGMQPVRRVKAEEPVAAVAPRGKRVARAAVAAVVPQHAPPAAEMRV